MSKPKKKSKKIYKQLRYQRRRRAEGRCAICGAKSGGHYRCASCRRARREKYAEEKA